MSVSQFEWRDVYAGPNRYCASETRSTVLSILLSLSLFAGLFLFVTLKDDLRGLEIHSPVFFRC